MRSLPPTGPAHHLDRLPTGCAPPPLRRHHAHLFTCEVPAVSTCKARQITDGVFDEGGPQWSPDGATLYFTSTRVPEPYVDELGDEIYAVAASGGAMRKVAAIEGSIGNLSVSPDGTQIAFVGTLRGKPIRSYSQPDLWVTSAAAASTPRNLTADYDFDIAGGIGGADQSV